MPKTLDPVKQRGDTRSGDDVLEAVHRVLHAVRAQHHQSKESSGLAPMEGRVLDFFARHPGATQSDLAAHTGRDKGQLARLVGSLKARGLLQPEADANDRRVTRLTPTAAGQAAARTMQAQRRRLSQFAAAGLSAAEKRQLLDLLARLHDRLTRNPP